MKISKELLYHLYWIDELDACQIAILFSCSHSTILRLMKKYNIRRRNKSERMIGAKNSMYGKNHTEDAKSRMSQNQKPNFTKERRKQISESVKRAWESEDFRKRHVEMAKTWTGDKNPFFGKKHTDETKKKLSEANMGRFVGENGSNWQGGKTEIGVLIRNSEKYIKWRDSIYKRDKFTCYCCGKVGGKMQVHHKKALSKIIGEHNIKDTIEANNCEAIWDTDNGVAMCFECHKGTETYGWKGISNGTTS